MSTRAYLEFLLQVVLRLAESEEGERLSRTRAEILACIIALYDDEDPIEEFNNTSMQECVAQLVGEKLKIEIPIKEVREVHALVSELCTSRTASAMDIEFIRACFFAPMCTEQQKDGAQLPS